MNGVRAQAQRVLALRHRVPAGVPAWDDRSGARGRVVITGSAGLIGGIVRAELGRDHALRGVDIVAGPGVDVVTDMCRLANVRRAFEGAEVVVDLAADGSPFSTWKTVCDNNVRATLNAFEAARDAGVKRVVFASSNRTVAMYERDEPYASVVSGEIDGLDPAALSRIRVDSPARPDSPYGVGKVMGEAAARYYADSAGLSVLCLRIGTVRPDDRPAQERHFATFLTHRDLAMLIRCCVEAPESLRYGVYFGVSANTWRIWELEPAREQLGYTPVDDAERWRESTG